MSYDDIHDGFMKPQHVCCRCLTDVIKGIHSFMSGIRESNELYSRLGVLY